MTSLYAVLPVWAVLVYHVASHCDILNPEPAFSDTVSNTSVIFSGQRLLGQCYHKCLANLRCMSFTQNKGSGQCWTYSIGFLQPTNFMPSSGSEYYRLTTGKCDRSLGYMQDRELGLCFRMVKYSGERNISTIRSVCNDGMGGRLLVVNDEQKQKLIERTMDVNHVDLLMVGLIYQRYRGWTWENGEHIGWANWQDGQPTLNGRCGFIIGSWGYEWDDDSCTTGWGTEMHIGCERP